ncbi:MAG: ROK family protein [Candidatus Acidiferrales bacterium]
MSADSFSIGIDFGGTNLRVAAYTPAAGFLDTVQIATRLRAGRDAVVADMCALIVQLRDRYAAKFALKGIAIGSPGPIELPEGRLRNLPNLPGFDGLELRTAVQQCVGSPVVVVENDANVAALAECVAGKGKTLGIDSLCFITLGTGVGGGIILHGKIQDGMNGMAGEVGHINIWPDGVACGCGANGCLEPLASATGVRRRAKEMIAAGKSAALAALEKRQPDFTTRDVAGLAAAGDADARTIFDEVGLALGRGLAAMVNTLNLPLYVVGGGLSLAWNLFSPALFKELRYRSYVYRMTDPQLTDAERGTRAKTYVTLTELGPEAGLLGACILPFTVSDGA